MAFPQTSASTESSFSTSGTTHNVSMPATVDSGDLLLVFISLHYNTFNSPATITTPSGWTEVWNGRHTVSSNVIEVGAYARDADGTEDSTTVNFETSGTNPDAAGAAQCYRITDWFGALSGVEAGAESNGASANPDPPSLTPSWGSEDTLWFAIAGAADDDATVSSYPSLFLNGVDTTSGASANNRSSIGTARRESTASVLDPGTFTLSEAELWIAQTVAVRPAGAATLLAETGGYTLTGQAVETRVGHVLTAEAGVYTVTGNDADTRKGSTLTADAGSYVLTGTAVEFSRGFRLEAAAGTYAFTGQGASTIYARLLGAEAGSYIVSGSDVVMLYTPIWEDAAAASTTWADVLAASTDWNDA